MEILKKILKPCITITILIFSLILIFGLGILLYFAYKYSLIIGAIFSMCVLGIVIPILYIIFEILNTKGGNYD